MKYWEFLIQKEGDQTWLPLETQQVEILEGRYRVVAHSDRLNTSLEIRVSQLMADEMPPRRKVRKRISQTDDAGLVVVMPFVHLSAGQWTLECSSLSVMDDLMGSGWQYGVQLQVFARSDEDWSAEWPVPTDSDTVASVMIEDSGADALGIINEDLPLIQAQAQLQSQFAIQSTDASTAEIQLYRVSLKQQAYLARRNQPMTITGKVHSLSAALSEAISQSAYEEASQLWIRLQNPETAQVIMEAHRPLSLARLPADFKVQIQLPTNVQTRVILGEVSLRTAANLNEASHPSQILASTAFTITAGIDQLLEAIVDQDAGTFEEEVSVFPGSTEPFVSSREASTPLSVPSLANASLNLVAKTVPAVGVVLPPQLHPQLNGGQLNGDLNPAEEADLSLDLAAETTAQVTAQVKSAADLSSEMAAKMLELPTFPASAGASAGASVESVSPSPMVAYPAQFVGTSIEDDDLEADEIAAVLEDIDQDLRLEESDLDALEPPGVEGLLPSLEADYAPPEPDYSPAHQGRQSPHKPSDKQANKPLDSQSSKRLEASIDFQALKLKDHFWQRLSALTHESHQEATKIAEGMKAAGVSRGRSAALPSSSTAFSEEVVIYDEPSPPINTGSGVSSGVSSGISSGVSSGISRANVPANIPTNPSPSVAAKPPSWQQQPPTSPPPASTAQGLPSEEDLPEMVLPVISVPMGDLIAGERVAVTVRTRPSVYKPFIKLWMIDRQSRSLVSEPQLLTGLSPDALGDLQVTTHLQVPMDCLDVQIAAIAIDMATQQESNKAIVNRHVVPAHQIPAARRFNL
jgi:hypothetical protein